MKRLLAVTTSLIAVLSAGAGITAYAEEGGTVYPEDKDFIKTFTFSSLSDYAVDGDEYAFADGKTVYLLHGAERETVEFKNNICAVDCKEGLFYCTDGTDTYSLPDKAVIAESSFQSSLENLTLGDYYYHFDREGALTAYNTETKISHTFGESFTNLKEYGGKAYVTGGNSLYALDGSSAIKQELVYADYSATHEIVIGHASENLKNYSEPVFVNIAAGTYMTAVDLTSLDGEFFVTEDTTVAKEDLTALLLCYADNAAIVSVGDLSYILLKSKTEETAVSCSEEAEFDNATVTGNRIYASPFVIIGTSSQDNASGMIVSVTGKLVYEGVLGSHFYEVEYFDGDGRVKKGYVADGFLTEYIIEDNKAPTEVDDPDYSENSNTKTIIIVFAVVVLVLAAVGYLAYVGTSDKKKKDKEKEKPEKEEK